jgi:CheY-like chemotaxis protein
MISRSPSEEEVDLQPTTQEFTTDQHVNPVNTFFPNDHTGRLSARGPPRQDKLNPMEGRPPMAGPIELKKDQDKPMLITYDRGIESTGAPERRSAEMPDPLSHSPGCRSPTHIAFLPGKDIAENHSFLRGIVGTNITRPRASSTSRSRGLACYQTMADLNHACKCPIVLIVDDTEINKIVLSGMLSRLGLAHLEACNGEEALAVLRKQNRKNRCSCAGIQLVLMDCGMPVMNGFEATLEIKRMIEQEEITPTTVVAVTAYEGTSIEQECKDVGMTEYINKPISIERLTQCLRDYLQP